jgi:hypothetical protein
VRQSTFVVLKLNFPDSLCPCGHIAPHAETKVGRGALQSEFLLNIAVYFSSGVSSLGIKFLLSQSDHILNIREYILGDVIELLKHDCSDLVDIIVTPLDLRLIVLGQGLTQNQIDRLDNVFGFLAVHASLVQRRRVWLLW